MSRDTAHAWYVVALTSERVRSADLRLAAMIDMREPGAQQYSTRGTGHGVATDVDARVTKPVTGRRRARRAGPHSLSCDARGATCCGGSRYSSQRQAQPQPSQYSGTYIQ